MLFAAMLVADLVVPKLYAHGAPRWTLHGKADDAFDFIAAVPLLAAIPVLVIAGSRSQTHRWRVALAGSYVYIVYQLLISTSSTRVGPLFIAYCATLALAAVGLFTLLKKLRRDHGSIDRRSARLAGAFLVGIGTLFAASWLTLDLPTLLDGTPSRDLSLFSNPLRVIDLSFVVPTHILVGMWIWQRRSAGELYAPILLSFDVIMSASMGGMMLAIELVGGVAAMPVAIAMFGIAGIEALVLVRVLDGQPRRPSDSSM